MSASQAKEIVVQWFESVWQKRAQDTIAELMTEKTVAHQPGGGKITGPAEFKQFHDQVLAGFPDQQLRILHAVGDDTQASVHWEVTGTHAGNFLGMAPTGRKVCFEGITFVTVADGKVTEGWDCWDMGALMARLAKA